MKKSRFVALPMAMLMASFALIGCTETTESSPSSSSGGTSGGGNTVADQLKAELSFDGETIRIVTPPGYGMINTDGTDPSLVRRDQRIEELEAK